MLYFNAQFLVLVNFTMHILVDNIRNTSLEFTLSKDKIKIVCYTDNARTIEINHDYTDINQMNTWLIQCGILPFDVITNNTTFQYDVKVKVLIAIVYYTPREGMPSFTRGVAYGPRALNTARGKAFSSEVYTVFSLCWTQKQIF